MTPARYSFALAIALLFVLALIGIGIRKQAYRAVAPPIYDPLGYMQKGKEVWSLVSQGEFARILNAPPALRPPGCVPFCYPFGYQEDFRSFLFWSTLSPIILWTISVFIALGRWTPAPGVAILPFAWSLGLISIPMSYHFEISGSNEMPFVGQWGLQDCLLASMAALATSLMILSARNRCAFLSIVGWSSAAYCLFIKPAGFLVMCAVAAIWSLEMAISALQNGLRAFSVWWLEVRKYLVITFLAGIAVYGFAILLALLSEYLSQDNVRSAKTAVEVLLSISIWADLFPTVTS
ncbi:MAG TPA: hypothetical protein VIS99_12395, partial [Terrimicrobiaceae bacterium]